MKNKFYYIQFLKKRTVSRSQYRFIYVNTFHSPTTVNKLILYFQPGISGSRKLTIESNCNTNTGQLLFREAGGVLIKVWPLKMGLEQEKCFVIGGI